MKCCRRPSESRRKTGRPLSFDRDAALEQAMLAFWRYGYESTSVVDLTAAMGVTAPSLYAAFGDKKRLFLAAVQRYAGDPEALNGAIDDAPTAYDAARQMLTAAADRLHRRDHPERVSARQRDGERVRRLGRRPARGRRYPQGDRSEISRSHRKRRPGQSSAVGHGRGGPGRARHGRHARPVGSGPRRRVPRVPAGRRRGHPEGLAWALIRAAPHRGIASQ